MMSFGTFVMLVVIVVVLVLVVTAGSRNRDPGTAQRGCGHCGAVHPHFASFCRRCGKRLG